jgi:hypothetical protein
MDFWTLKLVVEADEDRPALTPCVQIGGGTPFRSGLVLITLVDAHDAIRGAVQQCLSPDDIGNELRLPSIGFADRVLMEQVVRRGWDVGVETDGLERIRWRRYLAIGTAAFDDGAEITFAGPDGAIRPKAEDEGWGPEAPWDARDTDRLLANFVERGVIGESDRQAVLAEAVAQSRTAERILVERGHIGEREMLEAYAQVTGCELLDLRTHPIDPEAMAAIPEETAREYGLIAVGYHFDFLTVATSDPQNVKALRAIDTIARPYIALATREDVLKTLEGWP